MSDNSKIEWTDATWNPIRARNRKTGRIGHYCEVISPGCGRCYASAFQSRFGLPMYAGQPQREDRMTDLEVFLDEKVLRQPLGWKKSRRVFVASMTDLFGDWVPDEWLDRVFAVMSLASRHTFQVLTKRPGRMVIYFRDFFTERVFQAMEAIQPNWRVPGFESLESGRVVPVPIPNIWLGVSVENQQCANGRIPLLLQTPAVVRFLSVEPLLGPVNLTAIQTNSHWPGKSEPSKLDCLRGFTFSKRKRFVLNGIVEEKGETPFVDTETNRVDWVIVGGESGTEARPCAIDWIRSLVRECQAVKVPVFVKQLGAEAVHIVHNGCHGGETMERVGLRSRKGSNPDEWPSDLRIREFPTGVSQ